MNWFLKFLDVLFKYLGRYSTKVAEIALKLLYKHNQLLEEVGVDNTFEKKAVCKTCDSVYCFEKCLEKVGSRKVVSRCTFKPFRNTCNEPLMKVVVSSSGHQRFYPHKFYCFLNLISSLQILLLQTGFIEQCESTRENVASARLHS